MYLKGEMLSGICSLALPQHIDNLSKLEDRESYLGTFVIVLFVSTVAC